MGFLFAALAGGFFFFQSQATPRNAAEKLQTALVQKYPGAEVEVEVEGKRGVDIINGKFKAVHVKMAKFQTSDTGASLLAVPNAKKKGYLGKVIIHLRDFSFNKAHVAEAELEFNDITYDLNALKDRSQLAIVSAGPAKSRFVLPASSLEGTLRTKLPDVQNPKLSFSGGLIRISGSRATPVIGTPISFSFVAAPVMRGPELWMENIRVTLGGVPVPAIASNALLGNVNPVYVFDRERKLPLKVTSSTAVVREDALELTSVLTFIPAAKPGAAAQASTAIQ